KPRMAGLDNARPLRPQQIGELTKLRPLPGPIGQNGEMLDRYEPEIASIAEPETPAGTRRRLSRGAWIAAGLGLVAIVEGGVIARLATQASPPVGDAAVVIESPEPGDTVLLD